MEPAKVKGSLDSAPPIHDSINCDFGVTYYTELRGDNNNAKPTQVVLGGVDYALSPSNATRMGR
jgi:hypothetical protein